MHLALIDEIRIIWVPLQLGSREGGASGGGALSPGPPPETLLLNPTRALKRGPGPHATRLTRIAPFDFLNQ